MVSSHLKLADGKLFLIVFFYSESEYWSGDLCYNFLESLSYWPATVWASESTRDTRSIWQVIRPGKKSPVKAGTELFVISSSKFIITSIMWGFILDGVKIPNCEEVNLLESSIQRATDIEKIMLSLPASFDRFPLWIFYNSTPQGCKYVI